MADYAGVIRSEGLLEADLRHLRRLKQKVHTTLRACNRSDLTPCLEAVKGYDLGELAFIGALERQGSQGLHHRVDYAYTDQFFNGKLLIIKKDDGKPVTE